MRTLKHIGLWAILFFRIYSYLLSYGYDMELVTPVNVLLGILLKVFETLVSGILYVKI